jgi:hypothetical protein
VLGCFPRQPPVRERRPTATRPARPRRRRVQRAWGPSPLGPTGGPEARVPLARLSGWRFGVTTDTTIGSTDGGPVERDGAELSPRRGARRRCVSRARRAPLGDRRHRGALAACPSRCRRPRRTRGRTRIPAVPVSGCAVGAAGRPARRRRGGRRRRCVGVPDPRSIGCRNTVLGPLDVFRPARCRPRLRPQPARDRRLRRASAGWCCPLVRPGRPGD